MKVMFLSIMILSLSFTGCISTDSQIKASNCNTVNVNQLLSKGIYEREVYVSGTVAELGILNSKRFTLISKGKSLRVWYDMMVYPDRKQRPSVDISSLKNGQRVILKGVLKRKERYTNKNDFWIYEIIK